MSYQLTDANKHYIPNNDKLTFKFVIREEVESMCNILGINSNDWPIEKLKALENKIKSEHLENDTTWILFQKSWRVVNGLVKPSEVKSNTFVDGLKIFQAGEITPYKLTIENEHKVTNKWFKKVPSLRPNIFGGRVNIGSLLSKLKNGFDNLDMQVSIPDEIEADFTVPYGPMLKAHKKYKHGKFIPGSICVRGTGTTNLFEFFPYVKWAKTVKTNSQARLNSLFLLPYCTRLTYKDIHGKWIREI